MSPLLNLLRLRTLVHTTHPSNKQSTDSHPVASMVMGIMGNGNHHLLLQSELHGPGGRPGSLLTCNAKSTKARLARLFHHGYSHGRCELWLVCCLQGMRWEEPSCPVLTTSLTCLRFQRYVAPLISPPTPPQIEQDKASIDEQFNRAFSLLDQLSTDTATLKNAEEQRTERLDAALREVESVVSELKSASRRREDESRRISDEVRNLKDGIPKALDGAKETSDKRLKELGTELKSLKMLMANRLGGGSSAGTASPYSTTQGRATGATTPTVETEREEPMSEPATAATSVNGTTPAQQPYGSMTGGSSANSSSASRRDGNANPFPASAGGSGKAAIPAWQMAASKNASRSKPTSFDSGSSTPAGMQPGPQLGEVQRPEDVAASSAS